MSEHTENPTPTEGAGADPAPPAADVPGAETPPTTPPPAAAGTEGDGAAPTAEEAVEETAPPPVEEPPPAVAGEDVASAEEVVAEAEPDYKDQYLRAVAELDNVRKRARRDAAAGETRGIARLARALLPALDNLDRAIAAAEAQEGDEEHHLTRGIRLVQQELAGALQSVGIQADDPTGQPFDPHRHEAVAQQPVEGTESGVVVQVYQPGYHYEDTVLRAAKVIVSA